MAATLSVNLSAAPAKVETDGREERHSIEQQTPNPLADFFWQQLAISRADFRWPPAWLGIPNKIDAGGPEQAHIEERHFLYFSGSDVWRHGVFAHAGVLWSPGGLSSEGFTIKLLLNGGAYRYLSGALNNTTIIGRQSSITAMPGWRFKRSGYEVTIFAGFDYQQFLFVPNDPGTNLLGRHMGLRAGFELWHEPDATTMLTADASISSIAASNSARIAYGWRILDRFYLGPEAQIFSTDDYRHTRAGIHITALKIQDREWSGAIGYASDNDSRKGVYVRINVLTRH